MSRSRAPRHLVFVHSSDELYGADRVLLDVLAALSDEERRRSEFWVPTDTPHPASPLCRELAARGATVRHLDLPVLRRSYRTPRHLLRLALRTLRLFGALLRRRPEVVYCTTSATLLAAPVARWARVPLVVGHVQELWSEADRRVLAHLAASCERLLAISEPVRQALPGAVRERTHVVHNSTPEPREIEPLHGREGELTYLVASRWNSWKGHRTLLRAWQLAGCPGRLVVLGGRPATGEAVDVQRLAEQVAVRDSVEVVGEVADIEPYLSAADVMVVPSDSPEPFGLVAIEAFARARPVIGSAGGGLVEIISHGRDGWLYPMGDADALARLLRSLDRTAVGAAGEQAAATYRARFTRERYVGSWRRAVGLETLPHSGETDPTP